MRKIYTKSVWQFDKNGEAKLVHDECDFFYSMEPIASCDPVSAVTVLTTMTAATSAAAVFGAIATIGTYAAVIGTVFDAPGLKNIGLAMSTVGGIGSLATSLGGNFATMAQGVGGEAATAVGAPTGSAGGLINTAGDGVVNSFANAGLPVDFATQTAASGAAGATAFDPAIAGFENAGIMPAKTAQVAQEAVSGGVSAPIAPSAPIGASAPADPGTSILGGRSYANTVEGAQAAAKDLGAGGNDGFFSSALNFAKTQGGGMLGYGALSGIGTAYQASQENDLRQQQLAMQQANLDRQYANASAVPDLTAQLRTNRNANVTGNPQKRVGLLYANGLQRG